MIEEKIEEEKTLRVNSKQTDSLESLHQKGGGGLTARLTNDVLKTDKSKILEAEAKFDPESKEVVVSFKDFNQSGEEFSVNVCMLDILVDDKILDRHMVVVGKDMEKLRQGVTDYKLVLAQKQIISI